MATITDLPFDVFPLIFEHVPSRRTVFNALLVCKTFAEVSIPALYSTLTWRSSDQSAKFGPWATMRRRPEYYAHVVHLTQRSPTDMNPLLENESKFWSAVLPMLVNLRTYAWNMGGSTRIRGWEEVARSSVRALTCCPKLRIMSLPVVTAKVNWLDELHHTPSACSLTLYGRRDTTWRLSLPEEKPEPLSAVQRAACARLRNCTVKGAWPVSTTWFDPITPLSAMPGLSRLDLLHLDLHFGLSRLLSIVAPMARLEHLSLPYFHSINVGLPPAKESWARLPALRSFHIGYGPPGEGSIRAVIDDLCVWIDAFAELAPLHTLVVLGLEGSGCKIRESLMTIVLSHATTLKVLQIERFVLTPSHLQRIATSVPGLEELAFTATRPDICNVFLESNLEAEIMLEKLDVRCNWHQREFSSTDAEKLMEGLAHMRHLVVDRWLWERLWFLDTNGSLYREILEPVFLREDRDALLV